jgi:glycosyltransferase involved in cell wall biosynthesis
MTHIYFILGIFGGLGMTWLCPVLGMIYKTSERKAEPNWPPRSLEILIPAHNEEARIIETLTRIQKQSEECLKRNTQASISIRVGADACTDQTAERASQQGVSVETYSYRSKWKTLCSLIESSHTDWVGLVDAEAHWPEEFLRGLWDKRWSAPLVGIAPSFGEGWIWAIERHFKTLENFSGGPVSVHGATVFYERIALLEALAELGETEWINDDVVIPLTLRAKFPDRVLAYSVAENDPHQPAAPLSHVNERPRGRIPQEFKALLRRRRRMLAGNLQWITLLLPKVAKLSPLSALIAMRRVMRVFWAYWLLFLILGLPHYFWLSVILFALLLKRETVFAAFLASLTAPWLIYKRNTVNWT